MTSMAEISSENDEFFKMEQVKIDWGRWKEWILGPKVDTNSALMWLLHGRDAKSKPQHGVSSGSNIAPSQDTASPWHAWRISQDHETNQSPRQSIAVAGVFIAMPSCLDPEVVGIGRWWARRFGRPAQRRWKNEGLPQIRWFWQCCQVLLCSYGSLPISVVSLDLKKMVASLAALTATDWLGFFCFFWKECSVQQAFFTFTLSNPDFPLHYLEATSLLLLR